MIQLEFKLETLTIDTERYKRDTIKLISDRIRFAAAKFTQAALKRIPTFDNPNMPSERSTGFVAGAFNNLKAAIGSGYYKTQAFPNLDIIESRVGFKMRKGVKELYYPVTHPPKPGEYNRGKRIRLTHRVRHPKTGKMIDAPLSEEYYQGVFKTPQSGRQFATPPDQIFQQTSTGIQFRFAVNINYYAFHEVGALSGRGRSPYDPWRSFEAGRDAFFSVMGNQEAIFPPLTEYYISHTYKVSGDRVTLDQGRGSQFART